MKGILALIAFAAFIFLAYGQTPARPVWPNYFSASILVHRNDRPGREFFRWFYDSSQNKDRWDGIVRWQDADWFATLIFDHTKQLEYNVFYQQGTVLCVFNNLTRALPKPNFNNVRYIGKGLVEYTPAYHWTEEDRERGINFQVWDSQASRRNILRIDLDHQRERRAESFMFMEFDLTRQDPSLFTIPAEIFSQCTKAPLRF